MTEPEMTEPGANRRAARALAEVLRAENTALARGDADAAARLLPAKQDAAAALRSAAGLDRLTMQGLRDLAAENRTRLSQAIEVQGRILDMMVRAARESFPEPAAYMQGRPARGIAAMALHIRA